MEPTMRLGTRGSPLALAQANQVAEMLGGAKVVAIKTEDGALGDKARFVGGVERALIAGEVDIGVHSAKDVPADLPPELRIVGVPARESAADAYVGGASSLDAVAQGARIGTASLRRRAQLLARRPDLDVVELHGNVDTRLSRLRDGDLDGIVLAAAGLRRLGREGEIAFLLAGEEMVGAAGQGALALEARSEDEWAAAAGAKLSDHAALVEVTAERTVTVGLEATCDTPVGVNAVMDGGHLEISAFVGLPDGSEWIRDAVEGDAEDPLALAETLVGRLHSVGAAELLERAAAEVAR